MPSTTAHDAVQEHPADDVPHAPDCLMMGPCVLMLDVGRAAISTTAAVPSGRVVAVSDNFPASLTTSPDIPPPRA